LLPKPSPMIDTWVPPSLGPKVGEIEITFSNNVQVYFSNGPLVESQILSITPNRLEVVTPAATGPNASNANSIVDIRVVDPVSGQNATLGGGFQYGRGGGGALFISSLSPNQDEYLGGTLVTIFGQGFEEPVAVTMGQVAQQVISVTGTEVVVRTVRVPIGCANQTGPVGVTNIETNEGTTGPPFIYVPIQPVLISVDQSDANDGDPNGGQTIEIVGLPRSFGVGFDEPIRVTIDGVPATVLSFDGVDTLRVLTPAFSGNFQTEPCFTSGGQGSQQVPETVDVEVTNINTGCNDTLTSGFTYNPANSACVVVVNAAFNVSGDPGSFTANFFDQSSGSNLTYNWNFGDGNASTDQNPVNVYALPGTYTVTLTVFDGTTSDTATQDVEIPFPMP
ncbi:MAG: PKD domain-containing protein, partial [Acidobacteriota bacterium]